MAVQHAVNETGFISSVLPLNIHLVSRATRRMPFPNKLLPKRKRLWIAIMLILNIVYGISVILLVLCSRSSVSSLNPSQKATDFLRKKTEEVYNTVKKFDFIQAHIPVDTHGNQAKLEVLNLLKPVCQLSGLDFDDNRKDIRKRALSTVIRNWANNKGAERYLLWNGMKYENGSISVPVNGLYNVRSHVKFYVENNHANQSIKHFQHKLLRYIASTGKQELASSNTVSECTEGINDGAHLEYPSDLGCLVHLNAGDQLSVKVSHWDLLTHDRDWHSFGAYLI